MHFMTHSNTSITRLFALVLLAMPVIAGADVPCNPSDCRISLGAYAYKMQMNQTRLTSSTTLSNGVIWSSSYSSGTTNSSAYVQEAGSNVRNDFGSTTSWVSSDDNSSTGSDGRIRSYKSRATGYSIVEPGFLTPWGPARIEYYNQWQSERCPKANEGEGCDTDKGETPADQRLLWGDRPYASTGRFGGAQYVCNLDWRYVDDQNYKNDATGTYYSSSSTTGYEAYTARWEVWFSAEARPPTGMIPYLNDVMTITDYPAQGNPTTRVVRTHWPLTGASGSGPAADPASLYGKLSSGACRTWSHAAQIVYGPPPPPPGIRAASADTAPFDYRSIQHFPGEIDANTGLYFTGVYFVSNRVESERDVWLRHYYSRTNFSNYFFTILAPRWLSEAALSHSWMWEFTNNFNNPPGDLSQRCFGYPTLLACIVANVASPDSRERAAVVVPKPSPSPTPIASPGR